MSMFDETMDTAKAWLEMASQKPVDTVEQQKLRLSIMKKKSDLSHLYEVLGKLYYRYGDDAASRKGVQALRQDIDGVQAELEDLEYRLAHPVDHTPYEEPLEED